MRAAPGRSGQRSHHAGQPSPFGSCFTSPARMRCAFVAGALARRLDLSPELVLVQVVVPRRSPGGRRARTRAASPASARSPGERAVDAAERLDPDEVAQREHVERDLQPQLAVDVARRVRALARLVVLHDPARAERVDVDPVDLPREPQAVAEVEPALQLRRRALGAEGRPRAGAGRTVISDAASSRTKPSRSAMSVCRSSARLELASGRAERPTPARRRGSGGRARARHRGSPRSRARRRARAERRRRSGSAPCARPGRGASRPARRRSSSGSITRSTSQADEQSAKRSSSVAEKTVLLDIDSSTAGLASAVGRSNAERARSSRRVQPFAAARAAAPSSSSTASRARRAGALARSARTRAAR